MRSSSTGLLYHTYRTRPGDEEGHDPQRPWVVAYQENSDGAPLSLADPTPLSTRMIVESRHRDGDEAWRAARDREEHALVTVPQAAAILALSYPGANDLIRRRALVEVHREGNNRYFRRSDVERLAAEERRSGRPRTSQPPADGA